jgi:hypothetical protein
MVSRGLVLFYFSRWAPRASYRAYGSSRSQQATIVFHEAPGFTYFTLEVLSLPGLSSLHI